MWKCGSTKGGADEIAVGVDHRRPASTASSRPIAAIAVADDADVGRRAVGQGAALHQQVEGHQRSPRL